MYILIVHNEYLQGQILIQEVKIMATSSITKNFIIETKDQVEKFANAVEESYLESLNRKRKSYSDVFEYDENIIDKFLGKGNNK